MSHSLRQTLGDFSTEDIQLQLMFAMKTIKMKLRQEMCVPGWHSQKEYQKRKKDCTMIIHRLYTDLGVFGGICCRSIKL